MGAAIGVPVGVWLPVSGLRVLSLSMYAHYVFVMALGYSTKITLPEALVVMV